MQDRDTHEPDRGQPRASEVLRHVMKNRDSFPMPDQHEEVYIDIPESCWFDQLDWIHVTKSWFASFCGVKQSQVSRWISAGLPVRQDGRLDAWRANQWVLWYRERNRQRQNVGWTE